MTRLLAFALLLCPVVSAWAGEPPDVTALLLGLGAAAPAERERATEGLLAVGEPALPALRDALARTTDLDLRTRLGQIISAVEYQVAWKAWPNGVVAGVLARVAGERCGCGAADLPWKGEEVRTARFVRCLPNTRLVLLEWSCCQDRPVGARLFAVGRAAGDVVELRPGDHAHEAAFVTALAARLVPATDAATKEDVTLAVFGLTCLVGHGAPDAMAVVQPVGDAEMLVLLGKAGVCSVRFDARGVINGLNAYRP